ncbi:MAG: tyrosine--tRNA ligase [Phycisphaerales bacterium]|nr:tyrosine--tRNA ligase [Phycisphaerales bacterium]
MLDVEQQLERLLRGSDSTYSREELARKLTRAKEKNAPLRVKLGMDPTAPDLTLGHTVVLQKLRDFQDCGHKAVLIIGDYTAMIGDPSGKSKTRPILTPDQVKENAATYLTQAGKVIDTDESKLEIHYNSAWLSPLNFADVIRMAAQVTVARMMERDTFAKRMQAGAEVYCHELFYPMMQARDSVEIRADVELGGTDQTFNNLMGRDFQRAAGQEAQVVMVMPLLVGTDGKEKMSKSLGNYIGVTDPPSEMFAKVMSVPDELMRNYFTLLTRMDDTRAGELCDAKRTHPRDGKVELGKQIVTRFHDADSATKAADEFFRIHGAGKSGLPDEIDELRIPMQMTLDGVTTTALAVHCGFAKSNSEARRLISEGGVRLDGEPLTDPQRIVEVKTGQVLQRGKRRFVRLVVD